MRRDQKRGIKTKAGREARKSRATRTKPVAKKPAAKKVATKKVATEKPAAKKPATKKVANKKPAVTAIDTSMPASVFEKRKKIESILTDPTKTQGQKYLASIRLGLMKDSSKRNAGRRSGLTRQRNKNP